MNSEVELLRERIEAAEVVMAMASNDRPLVPVRRAIRHYANRYPTPLAGAKHVLAELAIHRALERIQRERLIWAMACFCDCAACARLYEVLREFDS